MMKEQFAAYDAGSVMILGIAGGNGLEHICSQKVSKVYGVDVNRNFLAECEMRYQELKHVLDLICVDLSNEDLQLPYAEFLVANLLVEYIGYEVKKSIERELPNGKKLMRLDFYNLEENKNATITPL